MVKVVKERWEVTQKLGVGAAAGGGCWMQVGVVMNDDASCKLFCLVSLF